MGKIRFGLYPIASLLSVIVENKGIKAIPTGEFREPKKGEWYLSGAIIEAYQAPNDLTTKYWIAQRVKTEVVEQISEFLPD